MIARNERSVVAIARVRRQRAGETFPLEIRPDAFGRQPMPILPPQPTDPNFIPNEFGAGVVIDRRGLILTAYHVLGEESDYYVTAADRKVYPATIKAADPRSDLAVLAIEAADLTPIALGNADELKKGQIVVNLGNPYAIARDGQASAAWGIVSNLHRKAPATPSESDPSGRPTLHHFGTLIQTDARLNLGTSGGPLLNLSGEMIGLCVALAAAPGYSRRRLCDCRRCDLPPGGRNAQTGPRGRIWLPGHSADESSAVRDHGGPKGNPDRANRRGHAGGALRAAAGDIVTAIDGTPIFDADALVLSVGRFPPRRSAAERAPRRPAAFDRRRR